MPGATATQKAPAEFSRLFWEEDRKSRAIAERRAIRERTRKELKAVCGEYGHEWFREVPDLSPDPVFESDWQETESSLRIYFRRCPHCGTRERVMAEPDQAVFRDLLLGERE